MPQVGRAGTQVKEHRMSVVRRVGKARIDRDALANGQERRRVIKDGKQDHHPVAQLAAQAGEGAQDYALVKNCDGSSAASP